MAESSLHDVALRTQSVGDNSPSDAPATTTDNQRIGGLSGEGNFTKENGTFAHDHIYSRTDDQALEDGTTRSDTDTSRANSVTGDSKSSDTKTIKKFVASKPTSFARYSLPKTITANAPPKATMDKASPSPAVSSTSSTPLGRPRLVAKSTNSNQQKLSAYKPVAPDPMQVWNKNRATPQTSTKHLTDEELKQQYGIHLTSRLQSDNDGKEAKWADIDDDEDDWAPETIEWNDGTKTTVNAADSQVSKPDTTAHEIQFDSTKSSAAPKSVRPPYPSSIGPNATVLKVGANIERQQAQRALAQQSKGPAEKSPALAARASPAPPPAKSPWAKLPEVEKVSPIAINPQPAVSLHARFPSMSSQTPVSAGSAQSPAKEISADDFNRSWRQSPSTQTKELFMPSSGRYEAVADGKRRMSKNEQAFRAPAVLQRPGQRDARAPAEPSAAFQTNRNSGDPARRRASSSVSGDSGQFTRKMSFVSSDTVNLSQADTSAQRPISRDGPSPQLPTPTTYQARGPDPAAVSPSGPTDADLEAQRAAQKALMREKIEKARQRKMEEEQRLEAEKQERIRQKLASLGPPPEPAKSKSEAPSDKNAEAPVLAAAAPAVQAVTAPLPSPPKPPQPILTGEPQQYGMMKVHPLDSVKRFGPPNSQATEAAKPSQDTKDAPLQPTHEKTKPLSPAVNGVPSVPDVTQPPSDDVNLPEAGSAPPKTLNHLGDGMRASWANATGDHRPTQTGSLWGLSSNKALGNGTFDQSLAGYSPQDLSRTSSTGQVWMNGRTPTMGQSPQMNHVSQYVPETRSQLLQSMTSPDPQPLSLNSEIDSALPISRPAPIGRPAATLGPPPPAVPPAQNNVNGFSAHGQANNVAAWNNFSNVARVQEKAETEKFNREFHERKEEERRSGTRQQAPYTFNETFKQVQTGDQVGQRHVSNVAHTAHVPSSMFGAVGSLPSADAPTRAPNGQYGHLGRGSRFFPQQHHTQSQQERRAITYSHPEVHRSPSPPPAEESASLHPAFDGDHHFPRVHFPREKAVVRLPPAAAPAPPVVREPSPPPAPPQPKVPLTWAARVSMPAPAPAPAPTPVRATSSPLAHNSSWQERFNGLLFPKQAAGPRLQPAPALAFTREPLDIVPVPTAASVSLPSTGKNEADEPNTDEPMSKNVEDEEDLFEDREAGSLPTILLPKNVPVLPFTYATLPRILPAPVDPNSIHMFMVSNWSERYGYARPQYAVIKAPGNSGKGIKRDLPVRNSASTAPVRRRNSFSTKHSIRAKPSQKPRVASKAH